MVAQRALVEDDLRTGRLVAPIPVSLRMPAGYYLALRRIGRALLT